MKSIIFNNKYYITDVLLYKKFLAIETNIKSRGKRRGRNRGKGMVKIKHVNILTVFYISLTIQSNLLSTRSFLTN